MNQSSFIGGALIAGFVLYVAAKGRLVQYADILWGNTNAPLPPFIGLPLLTVGGSGAPSPATKPDAMPWDSPSGAPALPSGGASLLPELGTAASDLLLLFGA